MRQKLLGQISEVVIIAIIVGHTSTAHTDGQEVYMSSTGGLGVHLLSVLNDGNAENKAAGDYDRWGGCTTMVVKEKIWWRTKEIKQGEQIIRKRYRMTGCDDVVPTKQGFSIFESIPVPFKSECDDAGSSDAVD
jgi:hypothetical protein